MRRSIRTSGILSIAAVLVCNTAVATPAPLPTPMAGIPFTPPRDVPGIATFSLCDGRNLTGTCFSTSITPATLGLCVDFSGANAFLADGGLVSVLAPPGFTLRLASEHNCVFTRGTSFSLEGGTFNTAQTPQSFVSSVAVVE